MKSMTVSKGFKKSEQSLIWNGVLVFFSFFFSFLPWLQGISVLTFFLIVWLRIVTATIIKLKNFEISLKWRQERIFNSMLLVSMLQQSRDMIIFKFLRTCLHSNALSKQIKILRKVSERSQILLWFSHCLGVKRWQTCCFFYLL